MGVWLVLDLLFTTLYFVVCETLWAGRTPGKQLTGLRVVSEGGHVVGLRASLLRNLLRAVDTLPAGYLIGLVAMILSPRVQRVGDVVAGTVVVRERANDPASGVGWSPVDPQVEAGFRLTREEVAAIGEVERRLIRQTLRRADALSNREARPLLDRACGAIGARIGRPEPIPGPLQRDFLKALLGASERLL